MVLHTRSEYVTVRTVFLYWFLRGQGLWGLCVHACMHMCEGGGGHSQALRVFSYITRGIGC